MEVGGIAVGVGIGKDRGARLTLASEVVEGGRVWQWQGGSGGGDGGRQQVPMVRQWERATWRLPWLALALASSASAFSFGFNWLWLQMVGFIFLA